MLSALAFIGGIIVGLIMVIVICSCVIAAKSYSKWKSESGPSESFGASVKREFRETFGMI